MTKSGFPHIEAHLQQHDLFVQKIEEFKLAYNYQSAVLSDQMITFLQKWFLIHIPTQDKDYVDFIKNKKELNLNDEQIILHTYICISVFQYSCPNANP